MGVYQGPDGRWFAAKTHKGERFQKSYNTRKAAELKYLEVLRRIEMADAIGEDPIKTITFNKYAKEYLIWAQHNKAPSTYTRDLTTVIKHLVPYFRRHKLTSIRGSMIETYKRSRLKVAAPRTVNTELVTLKAMLNRAVEWNYLQKSPGEYVKKLRLGRTPKIILTFDQINQFFESCRQSRTLCLFPFVVTGMNTGMRKSEMFHLEWTDLDFHYQQVHIRAKENWKPKSDAGHRIIPMNRLVHETLKAHPRHPNSSYVFYNPDGTRFHDIRGSFNNALNRAGLPHITFHRMRDIYLTYLSRSVDLPTAQEIAGHRDIQTTRQYINVLPDHIGNVVRNVEIGEL